jgi:septal ring factor EnvC (AmiA/AmiB activator)
LAAAHCCQYLAAQLRRNMDRQATAIKAKIDQIKQLGTAPAELAAELADLEKQYEKIQKKRWWASMKLIKTIDHHEFYA